MISLGDGRGPLLGKLRWRYLLPFLEEEPAISLAPEVYSSSLERQCGLGAAGALGARSALSALSI